MITQRDIDTVADAWTVLQAAIPEGIIDPTVDVPLALRDVGALLDRLYRLERKLRREVEGRAVRGGRVRATFT